MDIWTPTSSCEVCSDWKIQSSSNIDCVFHSHPESLLHHSNSFVTLPLSQIIMKQLLDAAIDLKAKGIFHRDLKLENILIEPSSDGPRVRIIDFGCGCNRRENCVYSQFSGTANLSCYPALHSSDCKISACSSSFVFFCLLLSGLL